ncbi:hypothetical protein E3N88_26319 [Mikania micrantha]|uniref:Uncharacterized protein n=1 Tax=Mikania micrantha TaxID=192012 RepID=A0A5N6N8Y0_9ASTR|nr:hypothetical protein E3N88_26319 [Mikania micrantha]
MTNVGERIEPQYTYTAQLGSGEPKPIAVRDGHPIGLSRYAKLERDNLNSPKTIAIRDGRSTSTIAVRGVFREQNDYFNHRGSIEDLKCKKTLEGHLAHPTTCATLLGRFQKILRPSSCCVVDHLVGS